MYKLKYIFCGFILQVNIASASGYLKSQKIVSGSDGRKCAAYIHGLDGSKGLPIVIMLAGTGVYSTGNVVDINPVAQTLIDQKKAVVLSIDKPGISYDESSSNHFKIDNEVYNKYTQSDLIECVVNAIAWVSSTDYTNGDADIYFLGHSEGTQVAMRSYDLILKEYSSIAVRIKGFFLSGLIMKSWTDIINYQLTDPIEKAKFWEAFQKHDDVTLRSMGDLAYAYWANIQSTETNESVLKRLAVNQPKAFIQIYHGLKDENTLPQPVMDFEAWNLDRLKHNESGWKLQARYYQASNGLNLAAMNDMIFALMAYLSP